MLRQLYATSLTLIIFSSDLSMRPRHSTTGEGHGALQIETNAMLLDGRWRVSLFCGFCKAAERKMNEQLTGQEKRCASGVSCNTTEARPVPNCFCIVIYMYGSPGYCSSPSQRRTRGVAMREEYRTIEA